jgi:hypothetical protein
MPPAQITDELSDWSDIAGTMSWESLLIGNGASRAIWERFSYPSLYEVAQIPTLSSHLSPEDIDLFARLGNTRSFEAVLSALLTSKSVAEALDLQPRDRIDRRYESIQSALVAAVHHVHVPWNVVPTPILSAIREALLQYEFIFSTNYDLLVYWAMMADNPAAFRDYFWGTSFDVGNTEIWGKATKVLYLHGGLHLYYSADGTTYKERADGYVNLLDLFGTRADAVPLCITEGTARQKLSAIARSDYLTFAYQQLGHRRGPLVLFGQGLGDTDKHIVDVLARQRHRTIAIGIYPVDSQETIKEKARLINLLPAADLVFFDSRTHPLGNPALRVG